jgi:hypothetical protein
MNENNNTNKKTYEELFEELVKANLPETTIKKNLGNLNKKEQKKDFVELTVTPFSRSDIKQEVDSFNNNLDSESLSSSNEISHKKESQPYCLECLEKSKELTN